MSAYPTEWEFDALLSDGATIHVRPISADDGPALVALHGRLSPATVYRRFFSPRRVLSDAEVLRFTHVDHRDRFALVGELDGRLAAVARYDRVGGDEAEVAFVVEDRHQGRGVGMLLLEHLAAAARERGVRRFVADTLVDNAPMLGVFRAAGFPLTRSHVDGVVRVSFPVEETGTALAAMEGREHRAEVASMRPLLRPGAVAVVGAGRQRGGIGHEIVRNLLLGGFEGVVHPVNRTARHVAGVPAVPSVTELPGPVDLAVVAVPAAGVEGVVAECGAAGVGAVVVVSAGFGEAGPEGAAAERRLVQVARRHGIRVVGPGSMGVITTAVGVSMNASLSPVVPPPGRVAVLSQSGALGVAVLRRAAELGVGLSSFVSLGNKADVSGNDLLQYWEADPDTDVVLLHLASFGNPRKFARIARRVARTKPIVAVAGGRAAGADALFRQAGVIGVGSLEELFDVAVLLASQPVPQGGRLVILGQAGGPGGLAADAGPGSGLAAAELSPATADALATELPGAVRLGNPVELLGLADPAQVGAAAGVLLADRGVDALLVAATPTPGSDPRQVGAAVAAAARARPGVPVVVTSPGLVAHTGLLPGTAIPAFPFPEQAVRALGLVADHGRWLRRPPGEPPVLDGIDREAAAAAVAEALADPRDGGWLPAGRAAALLATYGVATAAAVTVATADEAVAAAVDVGFPVAVKVASGAIPHRTDVGGVHLDLRSGDDVRRAFLGIHEGFGDTMGGAVVQAMVPAGVPTVVEVVQDPSFGPLVTFGVGGLATDLLGDRASRILPLTDVDADELVRSVRAAPLLFGYRGAPPVDVPALVDLLLRVAQLAGDVAEVAEVVIDPAIASPTGAVAVDVRVRLELPPPGPGPLLRRLR